MTTVFLLVLYLGNAPQQSDMYFYDINRCKYFATKISKQPPVPDTKKRYTGICKPVKINLKTNKATIYK